LMLVQAALTVGADGRFRVRRTGGRRSPDPEEFRRLYLAGVKMVLICRKMGFSRESLRQLRVRLGLPPRGPCGLPRHQVLWAEKRGAG
jgi:hypothetical protein